MANDQTDIWNVTATDSYTVTLNDSMTVSSGDQYLLVSGENSIEGVWTVQFINSTYFQYGSLVAGSTHDTGYLTCANGIVQVVVTSTSITFVGTSSFTSNQAFENIGQMITRNMDGSFNSGELDITVTQ